MNKDEPILRVENLSKSFEVDGHRRVGVLSPGERQKLAILLAIAVAFALAAPGIFGGALVPALAVLTALSWWCFIGPLHHFCYHQDLALK